MRWLQQELAWQRVYSSFRNADWNDSKRVPLEGLSLALGCSVAELRSLVQALELSIDSDGGVSYVNLTDRLYRSDRYCTPARFRPNERKDLARVAMESAGIDSYFLEDHHWAAIWDKHFERPGVFARDEASLHEWGPLSTAAASFNEPLRKSYDAGRTLRVMQWNVLAEGLVPEGFLSPLTSKEHIQNFKEYLLEKQMQGEADALSIAASLYAKKPRNVVWKQSQAAGEYVEFAQMAYETVVTMKGKKNEEKQKCGEQLTSCYNYSDQLTTNELAVTAAEHRLQRVLWFIEITQPDIIALEELDNFEFLCEELEKVGYMCCCDNAPKYVRLADRLPDLNSGNFGADYYARLCESWHAFVPKTGAAEGASNSRRLLQKRGKRPISGRTFAIDDDGAAIFWRTDRFRLIGRPEFRLLPGKADAQKAHGEKQSTPGPPTTDASDAGAVRVHLEFIERNSRYLGQQFYVTATHLSSGDEPDKEKRRVLEMGSLFDASSLPEILAMDANTCQDHELVDVPGLQEPTNAVQSLMASRNVDSVWDTYYGERQQEASPVSVWKMRGAGSKQPAKIGEAQYQLIDHIFFSGKRLFSRGRLALRLRERKRSEKAQTGDWLALMPNEVVPSDHLPVVWDFCLEEAPRFPADVLRQSAKSTLTGLVQQVALAHQDIRQELQRALPHIFQDKRRSLDAWFESAQVFLNDLRGVLIDDEGKTSVAVVLADVAGGMVFLAEICDQTQEVPESQVKSVGLCALRCVLRAQEAYIFRRNRSEHIEGLPNFLWRLAAQASELLLPDTTEEGSMRTPLGRNFDIPDPGSPLGSPGLLPPHPFTSSKQRRWLWKRKHSIEQERERGHRGRGPVVNVLDSGGVMADDASLDLLTSHVACNIEAGRYSHTAPALLALGSIPWGSGQGNGVQVRDAAEVAMEAASASCYTSTGSSASPSQAADKIWRGSEEDGAALVRDMATFVFKGLATSPNFDTGGAMALLIKEVNAVQDRATMNSGADAGAGSGEDSQQCSAYLAWLRTTMAVAFGKMAPEKLTVKVQKLKLDNAEAGKLAGAPECLGVSAVDVLIASFGSRQGGPEQVRTRGYLIKTLADLISEHSPEFALASMVQNAGIRKLRELLESIQQLPATDLERWRTQARIADLLVRLLGVHPGDPIQSMFQDHLKRDLMEDGLAELLCQLPDPVVVEASTHSKDLARFCRRLQGHLLQLFPDKVPRIVKG